MPEPLLNILKLFVLALLYLFFLRVLRAVWAEVSAPRAAAAPTTVTTPVARRERRRPGRSRGRPALVVIEPKEQKGRVYDLGDEVTVGRAAGCHITLDDNYVSQLHARVFRRDGAFMVEDLGSTNGTYLNRRKVTAPVALRAGDQLKIGMTVLEMQS